MNQSQSQRIEIFPEKEFETESLARQYRDDRLAQLQAQGYDCSVENLQTIHTGHWVFVLHISEAGPIQEPEDILLAERSKPSPKVKLNPKKYETR
jgi:hypothetical protein